MNNQIIKSEHRGSMELSWLKAKHSFSFGNYYNPDWNGFGFLKVINEDLIAPGAGFAKHPHKNMEIISFIISGELSHEDSLGNKEVLYPNEIQVMSAGSGILHSEYNRSNINPTHMLQIWVEPKTLNEAPSYQKYNFENNLLKNKLNLIASSLGDENFKGAKINQNFKLYYGKFESLESFVFELTNATKYFVQVIDGDFSLNDINLKEGDGLALQNNSQIIHINFRSKSSFLLFEV